ncbi:NCLDV major capsid protein [Hokovirus HKV1]|uniref:NCLDV major capsid protein n=1 Tax=Hokovirus HKV1 TaxID=1977638 RepID=A0A1V0SFY6_9VIRU|nr:NCLDV major capsid protein [Hokovirus HKV1]
MSCGNLLLTLTGEQDCYLTFEPQITLFLYVYKRHTNFALDTLKIFPISQNNNTFGSKYSFIIPKAGDLLSKTYIRIKIPEIILNNNNNNMNNDINKYLQIYKDLYILINNFCKAENNNNVKKIQEKIQKYFCNNELILEFKEFLENNNFFNYIFKWHDFDPYLLTLINTKELLKENINHLIYRIKLLIQKINNNNDNNNIISGAWVKRLGHAIIKTISVYIGGNKIDEHDGNWLNVWYSLTKKIDMKHVYNKMIGNVKILNKYNKKNKPKYTLFIPLRFWFCQYYENSLPLLCLQYNDVRIDLELNKFCKIFNTNSDIIYNKYKNHYLDVSLYANYIYLDELEREKFARGSVDYIINQLQIYQIYTNEQDILANLDIFAHPSREIIWTIQSSKLINYNNYYEMDNATIIFGSDNLTDRYNKEYYNYIQSYLYHTSSQKGIYIYSFSLIPENLQNSGSANLSVIKGPKLQIQLNKDRIDIKENKLITIYSRNINILRFYSGFGNLGFTYG